MNSILNSEVISPLIAVIEVGIIFRVVQKMITAQSDQGTLISAVKSCKKLLAAGAIAICVPSLVGVVRGFFDGGRFFDGSRTLLLNAAQVLIGVESIYLVFLEVSEGMMYQMADADEQPAHRKKMIEMFLIGIGIITVTGVLAVIWRYF